MSARQARRDIVRRLREEGAEAFRIGYSRERCPHTHMDAYQWRQGWDEAQSLERKTLIVDRELFEEAIAFVDRHSEDWYISGQDLLRRLREAL